MGEKKYSIFLKIRVHKGFFNNLGDLQSLQPPFKTETES